MIYWTSAWVLTIVPFHKHSWRTAVFFKELLIYNTQIGFFQFIYLKFTYKVWKWKQLFWKNARETVLKRFQLLPDEQIPTTLHPLSQSKIFFRRNREKKKVSNPQTNSKIIDYSICHTSPNIFLDCTGNSQEVVSVKLCSELFYSLLYYSLSEWK